MDRGARDRMIESAVVLLAQRGYTATSFSELLQASGAPRGSIYFHFPGGKDEIIGEAIRLQRSRAVAQLDALEGSPAVEVARAFVGLWRKLLTHTDFSTGCSLAAVAASASGPELVAEAAAAFAAWRQRLAEVLASGGMRVKDASSYAALLLSACEGAVVVARAEHDLTAFDAVATELLARAEALVGEAQR